MTPRRARKDMTDASDAAEQMENAEANDAIEPIESAEPTEPIDSTEPREPIDSREPSDQSDHFELPDGGSTSIGAVSHARRDGVGWRWVMNASRSQEPVRCLVFSASLRSRSLNSRLAELAAVTIEAHGGVVDRASMREFDTPSYDGDVQDRDGFPAGAEEMRDRLDQCDGFVISAPEYNASMPGVLKNAVDWVSRLSPQPFNELNGLLLSASPSMVGGNRGLWALRVPFEHLGARIYPDMFSLAQAHNALDSEGRIADKQLQERFDMNIVNFLDAVEAHKHYPCIKKAWFEYLGEQPEPATDRVE